MITCTRNNPKKCRAPQARRSALGIDGFLELRPERVGERRRHGVADLPVLALDVTRETVAVREALHTQTICVK